MLTNSNRTKKRLLVGFTAGFLAINGAQGIYQALLMDRRKRQFLAYLKNDARVTFGNFHRGSVYGYKHIRSSQDVYFAVDNSLMNDLSFVDMPRFGGCQKVI
ncbi:MAG: hypothetical protein ACTID1_03620 [Pseudolactococcus laudensis]